MPISEDDKLFAELWMQQYDLFLKLLAAIPLAELAVLAAWYSLMRDDQIVVAQSVGVIGAIAMLVPWFLLRRIIRNLQHFRSKIEHLFAGVAPNKVHTRWVGASLAVLCVLVNATLASGLIKLKPSQPSQTSAPGTNLLAPNSN